jgi:hypothetical protein
MVPQDDLRGEQYAADRKQGRQLFDLVAVGVEDRSYPPADSSVRLAHISDVLPAALGQQRVAAKCEHELVRQQDPNRARKAGSERDNGEHGPSVESAVIGLGPKKGARDRGGCKHRAGLISKLSCSIDAATGAFYKPAGTVPSSCRNTRDCCSRIAVTRSANRSLPPFLWERSFPRGG